MRRACTNGVRGVALVFGAVAIGSVAHAQDRASENVVTQAEDALRIRAGGSVRLLVTRDIQLRPYPENRRR